MLCATGRPLPAYRERTHVLADRAANRARCASISHTIHDHCAIVPCIPPAFWEWRRLRAACGMCRIPTAAKPEHVSSVQTQRSFTQHAYRSPFRAVRWLQNLKDSLMELPWFYHTYYSPSKIIIGTPISLVESAQAPWAEPLAAECGRGLKACTRSN